MQHSQELAGVIGAKETGRSILFSMRKLPGNGKNDPDVLAHKEEIA